MRERALTSTTASIQRLREIACAGYSSSGALDLFAKNMGMPSWSELEICMARGVVLLNDHIAEITRVLKSDMSISWAHLTNPELLAEWMFPAEFEAKAGADFNFAPEGWYGVIGVFEEGREIRFDAVAGGWTWFRLHQEDGKTVFRLWDYLPPDFVVPDDVSRGATDLTSIQPGGAGTHWQGVLAGWHSGLDELASTLGEENQQAIPYDVLDGLYKLLIEDYHNSPQ